MQYWQWICFSGFFTFKQETMKMKILILTGMVVFGSATLHAQTSGSNSTNGPTNSSEGSTGKNKKGKKAKTANLNQRKIYKWPSGQRATPTGEEATGTGAGYSSGKKDTSGKRED